MEIHDIIYIFICMYVCMYSFYGTFRSRARLRQRATNSTFHAGGVTLTNALDSSIALTHSGRKRNKLKRRRNGRDKPDRMSRNTKKKK